MRSWLFVPGHRQKMIDKAQALELDAAVLDLEDGAPPEEKDTARTLVSQAITAWCPGRAGPCCFARTDAAGSAALEADLNAIVRPGLAGVVLPKVEAAQDLRKIDTMLSDREQHAGMDPGTVQLIAIIESTRGLIAAAEIAAASPRMAGLLFGSEDFALDLGLLTVSQAEAGQMLYARSAVAIAAASQGLQAIDRVFLDVADDKGLHDDAAKGRELGFTGKALIHPNQISVVHNCLNPTPEQLQRAQSIVNAFDKAKAQGDGSTTVAGQLVDLPIMEKARRVLDSKR